MAQPPTIDRLLNQVPDSPQNVLTQLQTHSELASKQDAHGYSLLHAAVSYGHKNLLKALIEDYHVDPNLRDEDEETCLFNAETIELAKEALRLGVRIDAMNADGLTAMEKLADEDEQPEIAAFLRQESQQSGDARSADSSTPSAQPSSDTRSNGIHAPPSLPDGVEVNVGSMSADEVGGEPDPEFRRRIEELAARGDFEGEEGQRELRTLIEDAVSGMANEGQAPTSRRRLH